MNNNAPGGKKPTAEEKLAAFRANAKQITQPAAKKLQTPKPALNLNPPAPGKAIRQQQVRDNAAAAKAAAAPGPKPKEKTAQLQAKRDFAKAAAQRPTPAFNRAARITKTKTR